MFKAQCCVQLSLLDCMMWIVLTMTQSNARERLWLIFDEPKLISQKYYLRIFLIILNPVPFTYMETQII